MTFLLPHTPYQIRAMVQLTLFGKPVADPVPEEMPDEAEAEPPQPTKKKPRASSRGRGRGSHDGVPSAPADAEEPAPPTATDVVDVEKEPASAEVVVGDGDADVRDTSQALTLVSKAEMGDIACQSSAVSSALVVGSSFFCTKCGYTVDPTKLGTRVVRKLPPAFQCNKCNCKSTMLHRMFGTWPLEEFKDIDEATMQRFWQTATPDKCSLKKAVEEVLVSRMVESQIAEDAGPFLPLATWAAAPYHFDPSVIKAKAPMRVHPILGDTYQVKIVTTGEKKQRDFVREAMAKMMSHPPAASSSKGGPSMVEAGGGTGDGSGENLDDDTDGSSKDSSSSTSSSDSSGSSSERGKKHSKKKTSKKRTSKKLKKKEAKTALRQKQAAKKEKERQRQADKEEKAAIKLEKNRVAKAKGDASKILAKTASVAMQLDHMLKDKACSLVPSLILKKSQDNHKLLMQFEKEAKERIKAKCPLDLPFTLEDVTVACKDAMTNKSVLMSMLDSVKKM